MNNNTAIRSSRFTLSFIQAFFWLNVLILPVFDNMSGILFKLKVMGDGNIGSPSQLGRLIASVFVIFLIIKTGSKASKICASLIFVYFTFIELFSALIHVQLFPFLYGLITSSKLVYVSLCLIFFVDLVYKRKLNRFEIERWLIIYGTVISVLVLSAYISGFHIANYSKGIATRGLFISGNGLGVVMGSCALVLVHQTHKFSIKRIIHILMLLVTTALIGTKGGLIFFFCGFIYLCLKLATRHPVLSSLLFSVIAYYLFYPILELLFDVFENIIFKFENIDDKWTLLASSRDVFIIDAFENVIWTDWYSLRVLFGVGAFFGYLDPLMIVSGLRKSLENDLFELFFSYGIISTLSYCMLFFFGLFRAVLYQRYFYICLFSLVFIHSITAGHVLFNGTSSIMLAFIFSAILCKENNHYVNATVKVAG